VLHWLYFTPLRVHPQAWSQVIIWLAGAGVFLTVAGIYLGIARVRWHQDRVRWTPFRGMNLWHHVLGLVFGLLALTWVGSGLLSMNPWGLLESDYGADERTALQGVELSSSSALVVAATLAREGLPRAGGATPVQISSAPLAGRLYLLITAPGQRQRFDAATLTASVLTPQEIAQAFHGLGPQAQPALPVLLRQGDAYYHSDHEDDFEPAYRVLSGGPEPSSYYFDTVDGALLLKFDPPARGYRWWFNALHRWDFSPTLRRRPLWDLVVVSLLLGVSGLCVTGLVLGWRRVTD
jgi:hypothetical protein